MEVGQYIRYLRTSRGMTLTELGEKLGVQSSAVAKWESGRVKNLKRETIQKLADVFNVSPVSFIRADENGLSKESPQYQLVEIFKKLTPENRKKLLDLAVMFLQSQTNK